jgi:hypothetical protein
MANKRHWFCQHSDTYCGILVRKRWGNSRLRPSTGDDLMLGPNNDANALNTLWNSHALAKPRLAAG